MSGILRARFWNWSGLAAIAAFLAIVTLFAPHWIETVFGWDPDLRDGSVERLTIVALCCATASSSILAAYEWRRMQTADVA